MFLRVDKLQVDLPAPKRQDPNAAAALQELLGGKYGEMSTLGNYLFQSFNFQTDVLRMLGIRRQKCDSKTASIAHHRPIFVKRFERKSESFIFFHVLFQIVAFDRDVINRSRKADVVFVFHKVFLSGKILSINSRSAK